ncbi:NAD-specific glutamate dehydrogenase [bacterium HR40]|nr:NAD-specific glutamate dehydrogenase [bacterium HR40]
MTPRGEPGKAEILDRLEALVRERVPSGEVDLLCRFLRLVYAHVAPYDLAERTLDDLYGAALAHFRFGQIRPPQSLRLRVYNPRIEQHGWQSTHTIVETVNDDMPFLVDSTSIALNREGVAIHLIVHPVLHVRRDAAGRLVDIADGPGEGTFAESWMHLEIDRHTDHAFLARLEQRLAQVLADVRRAVEDWQAMRGRIDQALAEAAPGRRFLEEAEFAEIEAFLRWLADDHFTFLGFASYRLEEDVSRGLRLRREETSELGILRGVSDSPYSRSFEALPADVRRRAAEPLPLLIVTKANTKSTVHRDAYLDYIGVKRYASDGRVIGENRFLGLFTSAAYNRSPLSIPLLRRKLERVLERSGLDRRGHAGKALANILETYPRDELFQASEDELYATAVEILQLQDRLRIRLFPRRDPWGRFVTFLVYVPRDRYNTNLRERFQAILSEALESHDIEYQVQLTEALLARILFVVHTPRGIPQDLDARALELRLAEAARDWSDRLYEALLEAHGEETGNRLFRAFGRHFPVVYRDRVSPRVAVADVVALDALERGEAGPLALRLYRVLEEPVDLLHFRLIQPQSQVTLSAALPILERLGLEVLSEQPFEIRADGRVFWIHDFTLRHPQGAAIEVDGIRDLFDEAFLAVWTGAAENDGFGRLVLAAGLGWRDIVVLRAYCKYLLQLGTPFSQAYMEETLFRNPALARDLVALFRARFDPDREADRRQEDTERLRARILDGLERVQSLDEDRILRTYLGLVLATLRTNFFQTKPDGRPKDHLSFKFDPKAVPGMPLPKPAFEIFVYAPFVEGVHLRGGKVARGGIRWSDRREDYRTEILGLMKAQMVKNAVIVPVGAKGGFVVKRTPSERQALLEEGIRCYRTFLCGLLDLTDNQTRAGVVPPPRVVRYDDDDPYLVVAADKGTATFSDIANEISRAYGFWLDDAFASGGSAGYDHKKMGITARGVWESVKRHFREIGIDPERDTFTAVGIGDMSGDVFGNGMLLSDRIRLVAAFDHRHIFLDPDPDPKVAFAERRRLFELPRSSWDDYDRTKISPGGGVWSRRAKRVVLSPEVRRALAIEDTVLTPNELVSAILRAPVDLLWNGGIGTFVKARAESHADAQDRSNDAVRVDAEDLRCRVIAEGGNLGLTQRARIVFALRGGRLNTDFIDNSAGVDCSDHEVNIKILLRDVMEAGELTRIQRDRLLAAMTDEVAELVLRDNVLQNLALSVGQLRAAERLDAQLRLLRKLETSGRLDRRLEFLPDDDTLLERRRNGRGLTRPEAAVLLAHAKMALFDGLMATEVPGRPYFENDLCRYFPKPLVERYREAIARHPLRREIVATGLANGMVNYGLEEFASELEDDTGAELADIALAFVVARDALELECLWQAGCELGREVDAAQQLRLLDELRRTFVHATRWFLAHGPRPLVIREVVGLWRPGIRAIVGRLEEVLTLDQAEAVAQTVAEWRSAGLDPALARAAATLSCRLDACDIVAAARLAADGPASEAQLVALARIHFALSAELEIARLRNRLRAIPLSGRWERLAVSGLEDELSNLLRRLVLAAARSLPKAVESNELVSSLRAWLTSQVHGFARFRRVLDELETDAGADLARLAVAVRALSALEPVGGSGVAQISLNSSVET